MTFLAILSTGLILSTVYQYTVYSNKKNDLKKETTERHSQMKKFK